MDDIENEIEAAIAKDEIYSATVPLPPSNATWLEIREYEVFIRKQELFCIFFSSLVVTVFLHCLHLVGGVYKLYSNLVSHLCCLSRTGVGLIVLEMDVSVIQWKERILFS